MNGRKIGIAMMRSIDKAVATMSLKMTQISLIRKMKIIAMMKSMNAMRKNFIRKLPSKLLEVL